VIVVEQDISTPHAVRLKTALAILQRPHAVMITTVSCLTGGQEVGGVFGPRNLGGDLEGPRP